MFKIKKLTEKSFKDFDEDKISFNSLSHQEIINIYRDSKTILDINHPGQNGLTMRTFETLGSGRKLVTTNENVKRYPFYDANNIWVIDRENPQFDAAFFSSEFLPIQEDFYQSMSLNGWIQEVFGLKTTAHWSKVVEN